ncbi:MAG TPA: hypothetical protein EYP10_01905, partial [Armatimonadetes bacterium]|nr:hypothetical protein [Armatimonadota bacterium]
MMKVFGICTAFIAVTFSLTMLCVENCLANGDSKLIANASFEHGVDGKPSGWELSGNGKWMRRGRTGKRCVSVVGNGTDSGRWSCIVSELKPMALYRLTFWVKCDAGTSGGCVVAGVRGERKYKAEVVVAGINRDFGYSTQWRKCSYVFITPPDTKNLTIYIGQWHVRGRIYIDDVSLTPVQAIHAQRNGVVLGHDEEISNGNYIFTSRWRSEGSNYSRTLKHFTAGFNTNRWVMDEGASVTYLHNCGYRHKSAKVMVTLWWYQRGELVVEVSRDGKRWIEVARFKGEGEHEARLPEKIFPCTAFVRLRSEGLIQVTRYVYEAELGEPMRFMSLMPTVTPTVLPPPTVPKTPPTMSGSTTFITVEHRAPKDMSVRIASIGNPRTGNLAPKVRLENRSDRQRKFTIIVTASGERVKGVTARRDVVDARGDTTVEVPCPLRQWGRYDIAIAVREGRKRIFVASTSVNVAALHMSDYGELLTDGDALSVWWCESTYKVSRERPLPKRRGSEIRISAAANEYEPFQVVLRPKRELRNVRVSATELRFKRYTIPASAISVRTVEYVHVTRPTDAFGCVGWHPDPLPNHDMPITLRANLNQPFWLTVRVPKGTPKGTYRGSVTITADGIEPLRIPIALRVYGFELTDETHT